MSYRGWAPYVPVAERRAKAERAAQKAKKAGKDLSPVVLASRRTIAATFWGKAWCDNLEAYSDYANRMPRGRSYVRNGAVIDLKIEPGKVLAQVMGSRQYKVEIGITAVPKARWDALTRDCTGSIASLVELLQGKLSSAVMARLCQPKTGLFPAPAEIRLGCSCPDWATMCKHVAAVLYGIGARLDERPALLFTLRQVDAADLVAQATELPARARTAPAKSKVLDASALADVFGIEMATDVAGARAAPEAKRAPPATGDRKTKPKAKAKAKATTTAKPKVTTKSAAKTQVKTKAKVKVKVKVKVKSDAQPPREGASARRSTTPTATRTKARTTTRQSAPGKSRASAGKRDRRTT